MTRGNLLVAPHSPPALVDLSSHVVSQHGLSRRRRAAGWLTAAAGPLTLTGVLVHTRSAFDQGSQFILYLLAVLVAAMLGGAAPALLSAVVGVALLNWYFIEPLRGFAIADPDQVTALIVFSVVATAAGMFVTAFARRTMAAQRANLEAEELTRVTAGLAEADALRTAILRAVSHDLRTPLATIKASATSLLRADVDWPPQERQEFLTAIDHGADRLDHVIGDLLAASRLEAGAIAPELRPTAIEEIVAAALAGLDVLDGSVHVDVDPSLPLVHADGGLLGRAVGNVIGNALAYSPSQHRPMVTAQQRDHDVELRIVDHGPGINGRDLEHAFQPFQRLGDSGHRPGVGLGLHIAKGFVDAMHGTIALEDTPGGGLTAVIRLPSVDEHA